MPMLVGCWLLVVVLLLCLWLSLLLLVSCGNNVGSFALVLSTHPERRRLLVLFLSIRTAFIHWGWVVEKAKRVEVWRE